MDDSVKLGDIFRINQVKAMLEKRNLLLMIGLAVAGLSLLFLFYGYEETWMLWNIPTLSPHFADLRPITGGFQSYLQGQDPLINNLGDPWQRPLNYPRIWQSLYWIGVNDNHTTVLGIAIISLFLVGVYLFPPRMSNRSAFLMIAALLSPAVLLGIERANIDLLMFFLLSISIFLVRRNYITSLGLVLIAFILKLFPIFGLSIFLRRSKSDLIKIAGISLAIAVFYIVITFNDLVLIRQATPKGTYISYGVDVLWMSIVVPNYTEGLIIKALSYLNVLLAFFWSLRAMVTNQCLLDDKPDSCLDSFRVGSAVYIGTFLLGNNWDYRLMFLLFVIPQLVLWVRHSSRTIAEVSTVALLTTFISLWHFLIVRVTVDWFSLNSNISFFVDEIANWAVFYTLLYLFLCSLPAWIQQDIKSIKLINFLDKSQANG